MVRSTREEDVEPAHARAGMYEVISDEDLIEGLSFPRLPASCDLDRRSYGCRWHGQNDPHRPSTLRSYFRAYVRAETRCSNFLKV